MRGLALFLFVFAVAAVGCSRTERVTQLVVVVDSDLRAGVELARVDTDVTSSYGSATRTFHILASGKPDPRKNQATLPFSFAIVAPKGDASAKVTLNVNGLGPKGELLVRRRVRVGFVKGQKRLLRVVLERECASRFEGCEDKDQTCIAQACADIDIDVNKLPETKPGQEIQTKVDPWCKAENCTDAGMRDHDMDARIDSQVVSDLDAQLDTGSDGDIVGADASHDSGAVITCSDSQSAFFSDVSRTLARSFDFVCPVIAKPLYENPPKPAPLDNAVLLYQSAVYALNDLIAMPIAYDAGEDKFFLSDPNKADTRTDWELFYLFDRQDLSDGTDAPLLLTIMNTGGDTHRFATKLLDFLLQFDTRKGAIRTLIKPCRPIFISAYGASLSSAPLMALVHLRELLKMPKYASLQGLVHFGAQIPELDPATVLEGIDLAKEKNLELVQLDARSNGLWQTLHYARVVKHMATFLVGVSEPELGAAFCGNVDGFVSGTYAYDTSDFDANGVVSTRTRVNDSRHLLDVALETQAVGASFQFSAAAAGGARTATLGASDAPTITSGGAGFAGSVLSFDSDMSQHVALAETNDTLTPNSFAVLISARLNTNSLASGARQVLVSKRDAVSGWAIELVNEGSGTQLRFVVFVDNDSTLLPFSAEVAAPAAHQALLIAAEFDGNAWTGSSNGSKIHLSVGADESNATPLVVTTTPVTNDASITLGADPGASSGYFDGDLQLVRMTSF